MHTVYKITCDINGKAYIGCTSRPLHKRFSEHKYQASKGKKLKLYNAMRKYGTDSFTIEPICEYTNRDEMLKHEVHLIERHDTVINGYNNSMGGESGFYGIKGDKHPLYGTTRNQQQKDHQSKMMKGRFTGTENHFNGKSHSIESKQKISVKNRGMKPHTTKYWKVVLPNGDRIVTKDRVQFCKEHDLNYNSVRTATRNGKSYKNFKFDQLGE